MTPISEGDLDRLKDSHAALLDALVQITAPLPDGHLIVRVLIAESRLEQARAAIARAEKL